jgi:hypothetical protein
MKSADIALLLERLAQALRRGDELKLRRALEALASRDQSAKPVAKRGPAEKIDRKYIKEIETELVNAATRERGMEILLEAELTRVELVELAKSLSVHVTKSDNVGHIEEKLVEGVIGSRLSSAAIRGER